MCGITGVYHWSSDRPVAEAMLRAMATAIRHRGPDDEGYYLNGRVGLANLRLSIIDLAGGHQPMFNEDRSLCVVHNGEIYNYMELKRELVSRGHKYVTNSDTEVLLHGYEEFGLELLRKLNGMFAFALWDEKSKKLLLARDRVGIKPLHYAVVDGTLVFGSEIKAILASGLIAAEPNPLAIIDYYTKYKFLDCKTFFQGINTLPAGHYMVVSPEGFYTGEYWCWHLSDEIIIRQDENEIIGRTREVISNAVRSQMISDVPLGSYLSGGIDSSIVSICAEGSCGVAVPTFSASFDVPGFAFDESAYQSAVAKSMKGQNYRRTIVAQDMLDAIQDLVFHTDQPQSGITLAPLVMARFTRQHVKVALTGQGGDELFAGYYPVRVGHFWDAMSLSENRIEGAVNFLRAWGLMREYSSAAQILYNVILFGYYQYRLVRSFIKEVYSRRLHDVFEPDFLARVGDYSTLDHVLDLLDKRPTRSILNRMLYLDLELWLPQILMVDDKESMAASLENRVPLLDNQVTDWVTQLPVNVRVRDGTMKRLLKESFKSDLPKEVIEHRKVGFAQPMNEWFRTDCRGFVQGILFDGRTCRRGIIRQSYVEHIWQEHLSGRKDREWEIWQLLNLELWYRTFIDRPTVMMPGGDALETRD